MIVEIMVNMYIKKGWKPIGGIALRDVGLKEPMLYQAMVKEEEKRFSRGRQERL